ncbi:hypothetical protein KFE80_11495 [bacterium SCSIO 12696]|nr:hypothetical protein KFE80_11495 [bacterium SCSIO 12696]
MDFEARLAYAQETGDIWSSQWWLKPTWRNQIALSDDELESRFSRLADTFNSDWVQSLGGEIFSHPIARSQIAQFGMPDISNLLRVSGYLSDLSSLVGFGRVLRDYKTVQHSHSSELELFMANCLQKIGCEVSFIVPKPNGGKRPDISARFNDCGFVVECKRLARGPGEPWIENYQRVFSQILSDATPDGITLNFQRDLEPLDIHDYGYPYQLTPYQLAAQMDAYPIVAKIKESLKFGRTSAYFEVAGRGKCQLFSDNDSFKDRIEIPEFSENFYIKRLFLNGIFKANDQISEYGHSGIVAVFQEYPADLNAVKRELQKLFSKEARFKLLMGVLVFPAQNILKYIQPYWIQNQHADVCAKEVGLVERLEPLLRPLT